MSEDTLFYTYEDLEVEASIRRREKIWAVECPKCPATKGEPCVDALHYPREANHRARITAYKNSLREKEESA